MDISLNHKEYKILRTDKDNSVEEIVEAELSLPEYMPEILRIIKSTAEPKINSCKLIGDRVTVDGVCELCMVYTAEDGCIYAFSQSRPFTRYCESSEFADAVDTNAQITVSYVNCRATGTKRAEIKSGLNIKLNIYFSENEDIISVDDSFPMEKKIQTINALSLGCKKTRSFSMSDTISLEKPCAFIISKKANAVLAEIKKISNKIMLRGEAIVEICYVNSDNRALSEKIVHVIPINQIIELEGFEERFTGNVSLKVNGIDIIPKGEQNSFVTAFDIALNIDACATMWEETELSLICDAYCVDSNIDLKKQELIFYDCLNELSETYIYENSFTVSGEGVQNIVASEADITGVKAGCSDGELALEGNMCVSFIVRDTANSLSGSSKVFDFVYKKKLDFCTDNILCQPDINVISLKCNVKSSNIIEVRAEMKITGFVVRKVYADVVTDIAPCDIPINRRRMPVTVYFPDNENESLWSIARRYNTTVSAIAEENGISGDTTEKLKILFIPSA